MSPRDAPRVPVRQRATEKLQVYVTPYTAERLEKLRRRTGKATSVLARGFIEEGLGLRAESRGASARSIPRDEGREERIAERARELVRDQHVSQSVARRLATAELRIAGPYPRGGTEK